MSCDCPKCDCKTNNSSSFIFGIVLGAIIGAIIAIVIYRQNKGKVFDDLQKKLENFFKDFLNQENKFSTKSRPNLKTEENTVSSPNIVKNNPSITFVRKPKPKTFIKPKK